ncbi:MAG TPA: diguanylate cyclase [Burkholderiaceae bacterium]|jgi:diguanylate cyclase (GGDEF)-like protein
MQALSLRQQVILPFVVLVIFVSVAIGWVSIRAGENTVSDLTRRVLIETTGRIEYATDQTLSGAMIALEAVAPDPGDVPQAGQAIAFPTDPNILEQRFWAASSLFRSVNSFVYFGGADGRFVGLNRENKTKAMLFLRDAGDAQRRAFDSTGPGARGKMLRSDNYDPRTRPWFQQAIAKDQPVWSSVYNDFATRIPVITLAKSVYATDHHVVGVLATDMRLSTISDFLRSLEVSRNGVAFVIDEQGMLVASSTADLPVRMVDGVPQRLAAAEMDNPLIRHAYASYVAGRSPNGGVTAVQTSEFDHGSDKVELASAAIGGNFGLHWSAIVAVPRSDFMGEVTRSLYHSLAIGFCCVLVALGIGWFALNRVMRDIRQLTIAARKVGLGEPLPKLTIERSDELGQLAQTFNEMEQNLRIDHLTGVFNREFLMAQIGFMQRQAALQPFEPLSFALLFIDLDNFKSINDIYGHSSGDLVLKIVAQRLRELIRTSDVVARYGGDEFVVLLKGVTSIRDVVASEEKIRAAIAQPIELEQGSAQVGVSLGWAIFPQDGEDPEALLKIADLRMFDVKRMHRQKR